MKQSRKLSDATKHLRSDPVMKKLISRFGKLEFMVHEEDLFAEIVDSIISQQLSGKVAKVIYSRFEKLFPKKRVGPKFLLKIDDAKLRDVGMSWAKVTYLKDLAKKTLDGTLQLTRFNSLSDKEVVEHLVRVKGIGLWTAEMILMFSLRRPDVFSVSDLGLRTAVAKLYYVDREDFKRIEKISLQWSPYRTLACRYLWKSLGEK